MIKWCKSCVLPNTRPNIIIDKDGVCNACNFIEKLKIKSIGLTEKINLKFFVKR